MKNIKIKDTIHKELRIISAEEDKTIQDLLEEIIIKYLKNRKVKK